MRPMRREVVLFLICLAAQAGFAWVMRDVRPVLAIMELPPTVAAMKLNAAGDEQFAFRMLGVEVQNAGDTFGRVTPLKDYDYARLEQWLLRMDELDARSDWMPTLAGNYFSMTQKTDDLRYIVDYLDRHASRDPAKKWWWFMQATYLANHRLKDQDLALKMAQKLHDAPAPGKPLWANEMVAFIHEQRGEYAEALGIVGAILKESDKLSEGEMNFIRYFIEERIGMLKEAEARGLLGPANK